MGGPLWAPHYERLASFGRLVLFDKRGTGLSDPVPGAATLEERTDDLLAVMDAAESERAAIFGISEGGSMAALFAATHPERTSSLVLYGAWPRVLRGQDFPFGFDRLELESIAALTEARWGDGVALSSFAPSLGSDPRARESWARFQRAGASPGMARSLLQLYPDIDIREILPAIRAETLVLHRTGDRIVPVGCGRYLAEHIPGARYVELAGDDHLWVAGNADELLDEVEEFVTGARHSPAPDLPGRERSSYRAPSSTSLQDPGSCSRTAESTSSRESRARGGCSRSQPDGELIALLPAHLVRPTGSA